MLETFFTSFLHHVQAETNRYVLYVGNPCPWCHRAVLTLVLRGLTQHITIVNAVDDPERASRGGWVFDMPEPVFGRNDLRHGLAHFTPIFSSQSVCIAACIAVQ